MNRSGYSRRRASGVRLPNNPLIYSRVKIAVASRKRPVKAYLQYVEQARPNLPATKATW